MGAENGTFLELVAIYVEPDKTLAGQLKTFMELSIYEVEFLQCEVEKLDKLLQLISWALIVTGVETLFVPALLVESLSKYKFTSGSGNWVPLQSHTYGSVCDPWLK